MQTYTYIIHKIHSKCVICPFLCLKSSIYRILKWFLLKVLTWKCPNYCFKRLWPFTCNTAGLIPSGTKVILSVTGSKNGKDSQILVTKHRSNMSMTRAPQRRSPKFSVPLLDDKHLQMWKSEVQYTKFLWHFKTRENVMKLLNSFKKKNNFF